MTDGNLQISIDVTNRRVTTPETIQQRQDISIESSEDKKEENLYSIEGEGVVLEVFTIVHNNLYIHLLNDAW